MTSQRSASSRPNTIKFVLIGVLGLVLLYAAYDAISGDEETVAVTTSANETVAPVAPSTSEPSKMVTIPYRSLPTRSIGAALTHSPFEFDGTYLQKPLFDPPTHDLSNANAGNREADNANTGMMLAPESMAEIILETSQGRVAQIGEHLVREGSKVGDGIYVQRIENDRILLGSGEKQETDEDPED